MTTPAKPVLILCLAAGLACGRAASHGKASAAFTPAAVQSAVEQGVQEWQQGRLGELAAGMAKTEEERQQAMAILKGWTLPRETSAPRVVTIDGTGENTALVCALCSTDRGWIPVFFDCKAADGRVEAYRLREPGSGFDGRNGTGDYIAGIRAKMDDWRAVQGPDLAAKTETLKKRLAGELAAVRMAGREGLRLVHGYGTEETFARELSSLEKLSPEKIRAQVLSELDAALKSMEGR